MNTSARFICAVPLLCLLANVATAQSATTRIVGAANTFLSTLDEKQRKSVLFAFDDAQQRARWSNLPVTLAHRGGLSLQEMNAAQRSAALALVACALSRNGFEKDHDLPLSGGAR